MAVLKCKMCGGELAVQENSFICVCEYCGSQQTVPNVNDEKKVNLFGRANKLRSINEFDKAYSVYESIVEDFPEEAESYWGLVLCKYGIEYVDDPKTRTKIPTCHRSSFDSVLENENYLKAIQKSNPLARELYVAEAQAIETIRRGILEISSKEEPYDIFICYKETDKQGERTHDSVLAQNIYQELTEKGYRVFFSRITLEDKLGVKYEPYIFSALHSSKVMLVVGMDGDHLNAVWVKNEWSRYLKLIEAGEKKTLIPCYKGIDAYDLPEEFSDLQGQDMGKVGALQDLVRGIEKIIPKSAPVQQAAPVYASNMSAVNTEAMLKRAKMTLIDGDIKKAENLFEKVLELDDKCAEAFLHIDMIRHDAKDHIELAKKYASTNTPLSSYLKEAKSLAGGALWAVEFDKVYNEIIAEKERQKQEAEERKRKEEENKRLIAEKRLKYAAYFDIDENGVLHKYKGSGGDVLIPDFVTCIASEAFKDCESVTGLVIPSSVKKVCKDAFICTNITRIMLSPGLEVFEYSQDAFEDPFDLYIPSIEDWYKIQFVPADSNLMLGSKRLFINRKPVDHLVIPGTIKNIGKCKFYGCPVEKVTVSEGVETIGEDAFASSYIKELHLPSTLKSIDSGAFYDSYIEDITISEGITAIPESAFYDCGFLKSVTIPSNVVSIGECAFKGCSSLESITLPNTLVSIGDEAFMDCTSLKNIVLPTSIRSYGKDAFKDCKFVKERMHNGLCLFCGGKFPLFGGTCKSCGRQKSY